MNVSTAHSPICGNRKTTKGERRAKRAALINEIISEVHCNKRCKERKVDIINNKEQELCPALFSMIAVRDKTTRDTITKEGYMKTTLGNLAEGLFYVCKNLHKAVFLL